ncbi:hypothetical protein CCYA_CCYA07G2056 [Cyanidiococcus yangmingshanensis]|nr:hypothetical protein CCYA_CCYA07G2056 [Cyanidiococcus yangmingshanensis]
MGDRSTQSHIEAWESILTQARQKSLATWREADVQKALSWALLPSTGAGDPTGSVTEARVETLLKAWLEENPRWQPEFLEILLDAVSDLEEPVGQANKALERPLPPNLNGKIYELCVHGLASRVVNLSATTHINALMRSLGVE